MFPTKQRWAKNAVKSCAFWAYTTYAPMVLRSGHDSVLCLHRIVPSEVGGGRDDAVARRSPLVGVFVRWRALLFEAFAFERARGPRAFGELALLLRFRKAVPDAIDLGLLRLLFARLLLPESVQVDDVAGHLPQCDTPLPTVEWHRHFACETAAPWVHGIVAAARAVTAT